MIGVKVLTKSKEKFLEVVIFTFRVIFVRIWAKLTLLSSINSNKRSAQITRDQSFRLSSQEFQKIDNAKPLNQVFISLGKKWRAELLDCVISIAHRSTGMSNGVVN
ncbi:hypothetical protein Zmor_000344 [Zophobas morio]|uniref:Uncharacterized protein n=1 Tax=Zophobas morio TaxID=2755281 RepID=A0AA38J0M9_9CUCU|nr:hypothetical protein Zmor_000344 [Zophobas morio]